MGEYLLGVDAGGTHTVCLLADDRQRVLGRGEGGPSNVMAVGLGATVAAIRSAAAQAWVAAGLQPRPAAAMCVGVSGGDRPQEQQAIQSALQPLQVAQRIVIVNDARIALAAGSLDGVGVVLIAGTGSIAWGCNASGEVRRAGGWGYVMGDEGSAFAIGLSALHAVARADDGRGQATLLTRLLLDHWHLDRLQDVRSIVYTPTYPRLEIAALAPLVEQAARQGDAVARGIYEQAACELALAATTVLSGLGMTDQTVDIVLSGGVYHAGDLVTVPLLRAVREIAPQARLIALHDEPALGALHLAARQLD
jgi:N-acetylglucosamine kinase-like BadF-type ATPase